ncbi:MAG: DNRLRE domain-containing protein [Candidatus Coatesbacteria bacterium]|nr:MAG: DNRLRE domain-containing protein [Candidatus Coatesbacteria bacterium]
MKKTITLVVFLALIAVPALATTHNVTIQPDGAGSKDAGIWEAMPDNNYGNDEEFWIGDDSGWCDTLIKFNGLDAYSGVTVIYADINLYTTWEWGGTLSNNNFVDRANGSWNEGTVTWNTAPGWDGSITEYFNAPAVDTWVVVDVTAIVQSWLDGSYSHRGFYIGSDDANERGRYFASGEYTTNPDHRPFIYMEYEYTNITPASLGSIKAGYK